MFYVLLYVTYVHSSYHLNGEERERERERESWLLCLASCDCCVALLHDAMGLSAVCDYGIGIL